MRAEDGEDLLAGYVSGPAAATEATALGLVRADEAAVVVLVEGVSDQIAVETLARRYGRDLAGDGVVVLPSGGVHGIVRYWRRFGPQGTGVRVVGLCDAGEAHVIRRELGTQGLFVCVEDLEDELIRAAEAGLVEEVFAAHGTWGRFGLFSGSRRGGGKTRRRRCGGPLGRGRSASCGTRSC